jgi:hypothetical protein
MEVEIEIRAVDFIFRSEPWDSMGKGFIGYLVPVVAPTLGGHGSMEKEGKAAEETVTTLVEDGLNPSKLSAMNPSELFRMAAELGLAIEPMPSSSAQDFRLTRYIE